MEWLLLFIPLIGIGVAHYYYKEELTVWEILLPFCLSAIIIMTTKLVSDRIQVSDDEYWGSMIVEARYYEYWETYVEETCTRTYECGTSDKPQTCTETYDCSYCDEHRAYWEAYDNAGNSWRISEKYFKFLCKKWKKKAEFVELNRRINKTLFCGKDGDMYRIRWGGEIETSEASVTIHSYTNRVQASHSAFKLSNISKRQASSLGLYEYPEIVTFYKQRCILGIDSVYNPNQVETIEQWFQYLNGYYGSINKVKVFVLIFYDKPIQISFEQEAYWDGGNQNEVIITLSLDRKTKRIQWVRPFSWTDNKRLTVDLRDDVSSINTFNPRKLYDIIIKDIGNSDVHKSFEKDFSYLSVDLTTGNYIVMTILCVLTTISSLIWSIGNEFKKTKYEY